MYVYVSLTTGFVVDMVSGYVRTQSYSIADMHKRETEILSKAEQTVYSKLPLYKRVSNSTCTIFSSGSVYIHVHV